MMKKELIFDAAIFSMDAILATAYWCADKAIVDVVSGKGNDIVVTISSRKGFVLDSDFFESFQTMVVHNQIRHRLEEKFAPLEKMIVEKAFSPITMKG